MSRDWSRNCPDFERMHQLHLCFFLWSSSLSTENPKTGTAAIWSQLAGAPCADSPENGYVIWNLYQTGPVKKNRKGMNQKPCTNAVEQRVCDLILLFRISSAQFEFVAKSNFRTVTKGRARRALLVKEGREVSGFCLWTFNLGQISGHTAIHSLIGLGQSNPSKNPWPLASLAQVVPDCRTGFWKCTWTFGPFEVANP